MVAKAPVPKKIEFGILPKWDAEVETSIHKQLVIFDMVKFCILKEVNKLLVEFSAKSSNRFLASLCEPGFINFARQSPIQRPFVVVAKNVNEVFNFQKFIDTGRGVGPSVNYIAQANLLIFFIIETRSFEALN